MHELGINLSDRQPQLLTGELTEQADLIVTMGCGDECPYGPGKRYVDWDLHDPKGRPLGEVRATRAMTLRGRSTLRFFGCGARHCGSSGPGI
jgi:arsenate reductase